MKLIDIHMHVVPDVDDGSRNMSESLEMLRTAQQQGADAVIATPHSFAFDIYDKEIILDRFHALQEAVRTNGIPIELRLGCEVCCQKYAMKEILLQLQEGQYPTMNGTRYVLTEFLPRTVKDDAYFCVEQLISAGFIPLIAHAERYDFINPDTAAELRDRGAFIQINAYSVCEDFHEKIIACANQLLHAGLVDFFGSDAHRMDHRPPAVRKGVECLYSTYESGYVDHILFENARDHLL